MSDQLCRRSAVNAVLDLLRRLLRGLDWREGRATPERTLIGLDRAPRIRKALGGRVIRTAPRQRDGAPDQLPLAAGARRRFRLVPIGRRRPSGSRRPYGR